MKMIAKTLADGLALILVTPALLLYHLGCWTIGPQRAFPGWSQAFALIPGWTGVYLRRAFYRTVLPQVRTGLLPFLRHQFSRTRPRRSAGMFTSELFCSIGDVTLEDDVLVSSHVSITNGVLSTALSRLDIPVREQPGTWSRVTIGRDSWIGEHATVMADVGKHCVIGAGSVVTRPIPDYAIAVGVPARVIRYRNQDLDSSQASATGRNDAPNRRAEPSQYTSFSQ